MFFLIILEIFDMLPYSYNMMIISIGRKWRHYLFEGSFPLPNYRPCFFSELSASKFSLTAPYLWAWQTTAL